MAKEEKLSYEAQLAIHTAEFAKVEPKDNWKDPIDTTIATPTAEEQAAITDAVIYFCGCVPEFYPTKDGKTRVIAEGYYNAVGA